MYTVDYFISKFEAIPEESWLVGSYNNLEQDKFCAYGHCGLRAGGSLGSKNEADGLARIFNTLNVTDSDVASVNDGSCEYYNQPTPKQRILAALYDIKRKQDGDVGKVKEEETFKPVEIKSEFIPVTFKEIKIPEHSIN